MKLHSQSHTDHVPPEVVQCVLGRFADRTARFVATFELPDDLPTLECRLYGPACGDDPVSEIDVHWARRPGRNWDSRLVDRPVRKTRVCTVIAGPFDGEPCVLYTVYGGPHAQREPADPAVTSETEMDRCVEFWLNHALSSQGLAVTVAEEVN